ncbi:peptidoglycan-binding protein [Sphingobium subterraneum]|uniref:Peptidoglycan-binding protein n=1 Tax=Sphingobium subterraneum TaxID=627688 RepID=A0A841J0I6_9SPHN|nr:peptidoglycan-binding protein [Sphingobium subterraneum]MBB6124130.1 hypothetical protein [Sphingobium subterraneum]
MNMASPITEGQAARLSPRQKADVILSAARADMAQRLWQVAIGGADDDEPAVAGVRAQGDAPLTLDAVLATLGIADNITPSVGSPAPVDIPTPPQTKSMARSPSPAGAGLGANEAFRPALATASARTGIPQAALAAIVDAEASRGPDGAWNPLSRNPRSSAAGLGQFLSGTWIGMAQQPDTFLHDAARQRGWLDAQGRVRGEARSALLALRDDAAASIETVADYARVNIARLRHAGVPIGSGVGATAQAAYLGHHLGLGDAVKFLRGTIDAGRAERLLSAQVGDVQARRLIAGAGDAALAHRTWLTAYVARSVRPDRYQQL